MVADDVAVGEGGVCKSDNIRFIINVLPGKITTGPVALVYLTSNDLSDLTTSTTSTTTTTTTSDFQLATNQEYKSSELSSTPAESDLYSTETINVSDLK